MKNKELFEKTVGILDRAYMNNTLRRGNCSACAVGNLVAHGMGMKVALSRPGYFINKLSVDFVPSKWDCVFITSFGRQSFHHGNYFGDAKKQIDSTGYTPFELAKIEFAFESSDRGCSQNEGMLNGLLAVYDVLCEIHEVDAKDVPNGKEVFVLC